MSTARTPRGCTCCSRPPSSASCSGAWAGRSCAPPERVAPSPQGPQGHCGPSALAAARVGPRARLRKRAAGPERSGRPESRGRAQRQHCMGAGVRQAGWAGHARTAGAPQATRCMDEHLLNVAIATLMKLSNVLAEHVAAAGSPQFRRVRALPPAGWVRLRSRRCLPGGDCSGLHDGPLRAVLRR
jgi:hypothetical protein